MVRAGGCIGASVGQSGSFRGAGYSQLERNNVACSIEYSVVLRRTYPILHNDTIECLLQIFPPKKMAA